MGKTIRIQTAAGMRLLREQGDEGFSFMETIISLAIIMILTAAVGLGALRYLDQARLAACRSHMETFGKALQSYYADCGVYPTQAQGLEALWRKPHLSPVPARWAGPYLDREVPDDPWGNPYLYAVPGENGLPYQISSYGSDGQAGGEGMAADIISWQKDGSREGTR